MKIECAKKLVISLFLIILLVVVGSCATKETKPTAAAPTTAAATTAAPTVKKPASITIYAMLDLSGPYASSMVGAREAYMDCTEYINTVQGGIDGVPVVLDLYDNGSKPENSVNWYENIRKLPTKPVFTLPVNQADGELLHDRLIEDKIVAITGTTVKCLYPLGYSFGEWAFWDEQFGVFLDWAVNNWKESRPMKVAFLTWDSTFGRGCLTDQAYAYAKQKGVNVVATELFPMTSLDVGTQLVRLREKSPDWIYTNTLGTGPAVILKSAAGLGYTIKLASCMAVEESALRLADPALFNGFVISSCYRSWAEIDHPSIKLLNDWYVKKNRDPAKKGQMSKLPWGFELTGAEAIARAVKAVGWDKLDGTAVRDQFLKMDDYEPLFGLTRISYSSAHPAPLSMYVAEVHDGKFIPITSWLKAPNLR